ncbi:hypothetical protein ACO0K3_02885 [Undibacterium sp. Rencai35W]|uniref:hypothetical protein n=1 Tax=Undibacterium sp. Rencai35W TaxID=3413046 RepID=UPI003BF194DF
MSENYKRFGIPKQNLDAAQKAKKNQKNANYCCYVPTRDQVANADIDIIKKLLVDWMCHSPTELIPSKTQIAEVRAILMARSDASSLSGLLTMCSYYISSD